MIYEKELTCSFCGKKESEVDMLFANEDMNAFICNECIEAREESFEEESKYEFEMDEVELLKPKEIKAKLDEYIIGQENAKI